ncbi:chorismate mutase [Subtercola boreus]|uniref:Chorismate mutase n=1 Tax=Subtercola boreus TaxID=120213 RepID=A0A3E0VME8_9MICO|nr:chorismate mutase [Subtercola boreus]RFA10603.1 chorismate mutase [Subtercola boreus]TQL55845.1 chorismate mutase [Subtercola boreus]
MDVNEPAAAAPNSEETAWALRQLENIRESIDNVDAALIHLLAERFKFTQQVGRLKARHGLPAADLDREARQIKRLRGLAEEAHLDPEFAEKFLGFIVAEVIHHHVKIANDTGAIPTP